MLLVRACGCPGGYFGGRRKKVNAGQVSWRAVGYRSQAKDAPLTNCDAEIAILECVRRQSGADGEGHWKSAFGARWCLAAGQVAAAAAADECLITSSDGNAAKTGIASVTISLDEHRVSNNHNNGCLLGNRPAVS